MNRINSLISMHCAQNCMKLLIGAFDKGKNDVTSDYPADLKLSENVCY